MTKSTKINNSTWDADDGAIWDEQAKISSKAMQDALAAQQRAFIAAGVGMSSAGLSSGTSIPAPTYPSTFGTASLLPLTALSLIDMLDKGKLYNWAGDLYLVAAGTAYFVNEGVWTESHNKVSMIETHGIFLGTVQDLLFKLDDAL